MTNWSELLSLGSFFCNGCTALQSVDLSGCGKLTTINSDFLNGCNAVNTWII